jgi:membrane protease YdiL (CAAX protease family)
MSKEAQRSVKYCVHCGTRVFEGQAYCSKCGKLVVQIKSGKESPQPKTIRIAPIKKKISRKCPGCGSLINSTILKQCPICDTLLEEIPEDQITLKKKSERTGYIFTNKKLEPEKNYVIKRDSWNFKEGINVFTNSLMVYITIELLIIMILWMQIDPEKSIAIELNIFNIIISQIPGILFGLYAIGYILANKHNIKKLGFLYDRNKILFAVIIGILGGFLLLFINIFSNFMNQVLNNMGWTLINITEYNVNQNNVIANADLIWIIVLGGLICLSSISTEIVLRGVLHNTLTNKFEKNFKGKLIIITIISLAYGGIYLLFSFAIGITFFILNFLIGFILGVLYEINGNIYNTLVAACVYNILLLIAVIYF